jgi:hypothetical protein
MATLVAAALAAAAATPVTVEIVASGHVDTPASAYRVSGSLLACGATQGEADRLLAQKVAAIDQSVAALGAKKGQGAEKPSLTGMVASFMATRTASECNSDMTALLALPGAGKSPAKTNDATSGPKFGANASLSFDAPDRATAARVIAALKAADAKPSDAVIPVLVDDTVPRRAAKQQALAKARTEADAYAAPLALGRVTLAAISERQDIGSVDYLGQMLRSFGLPMTTATDMVATDVTLTVTFRLEPR